MGAISWQGRLRSSSHGRSTTNGRLTAHGWSTTNGRLTAHGSTAERGSANGWAANGRAAADRRASADGRATDSSSRKRGVGVGSTSDGRASCWTPLGFSGNPYAAGAFQRNAGASALYAQPASLIIWRFGKLGSVAGEPAWRTCRSGGAVCCMTWRPTTTDNLYQKGGSFSSGGAASDPQRLSNFP